MGDDLVEITRGDYDVELDIVYATDRNFTGQVIYQDARCWLHPSAAVCLRTAIASARMVGLKLKIFDAWRPPQAQDALWKYLPDPSYVADPSVGSNHSRAVAVDVTLIDSQGDELDMGTRYDEMSMASWHSCDRLTVVAQKNRLLLLGIMLAAGFSYLESEWWHYELPGARHFPLRWQPCST
ncbi:D-alanyl-D-alanine dipeptidase [Burkholderia gladioli]|uniref:D-alanyl-D-alanine dipeptidase n=1 Tax=Burkholderia gladioli TaxID=28095 RepID=UPI00164057C7|nr:D-alanyl-D-alanine dipeptidase [Burkholderia gladioli]